jgi:glucose-6-phosphate 1-epimerase
LDSPDAISDLDKRFGIAGAVRIVPGNGGLSKVEASVPGGKGEMYLHGAHVTSWIPMGAAEVLYLSPNSIWKDGYAIRGGVPVSFPWFADRAGDPAAPAHGFVRTRAWQLQSIEKAGDDVIVSMSTESDEATQKWWPADFRIVCRATFGGKLKIELIVSNSGVSPLSFEEALHAYFQVENAETASVHGLNATDFIDKNDKHVVKRQNGDVRLTSATDSVYLNTQQELALFDPTLKRRISIRKENSLTTVVWNPWAEKSRAMSDLGPDRWKGFICIETSNVAPYSVKLDPGQQHSMAALIQVAL